MKKIYFYLLSMLLIISVSSSAQSSNNLERLYQQAWDYYKGENGKRQDIEQALSLFAQAAEQGHAMAIEKLEKIKPKIKNLLYLT